MNTGKVPETLAYSLAVGATDIGLGKHYAPTQHDVTLADASRFDLQKATHSKKRWAQKVDNWRRHPLLLQGGGSNQWLAQTIGATWTLGKGALKNSAIPMLIFQASDDTYVVTPSQNKVCESVIHCELVRFENSFHEIFLETDNIRDEAVSDMFSFLEKN